MECILGIISILFDKVIEVISALGYWGLAIGMGIESANIPLPSELILPLGGYLVYKGELTFWGAVFAGTVGGTIGSILSYCLGFYGGRPFLLKYGKYIKFSEQHLDLADKWFHKYGELTVFFTRLMPIIRTFISLPAGISGMNFPRFMIYTFLGSLPWSILLVYVGMKLGEHWRLIGDYFHKADIVIVFFIVLLIGFFIWKKRKKSKSKF